MADLGTHRTPLRRVCGRGPDVTSRPRANEAAWPQGSIAQQSRTQNLKGFPGSAAAPRLLSSRAAAHRSRRALLGRRPGRSFRRGAFYVSNTPPARHARAPPPPRSPLLCPPIPPPDLALGPALAAGPPAPPSPGGRVRAAAESRTPTDCGPGRPPSFAGQGGPGTPRSAIPAPAGKSPRAALPGPEEQPTPGSYPEGPCCGGGAQT